MKLPEPSKKGKSSTPSEVPAGKAASRAEHWTKVSGRDYIEGGALTAGGAKKGKASDLATKEKLDNKRKSIAKTEVARGNAPNPALMTIHEVDEESNHEGLVFLVHKRSRVVPTPLGIESPLPIPQPIS